MAEDHAQQVVVGHVDAPWGIKGWIRVFSFTDPMARILDYTPWQLVKGGKQQTLAVTEGKRQGKGLVALLDGFENRSHAELLVGADIRIDKDQLPGLMQGEYYWHELEGLIVVNQQGECLGRVDHMIETGANDVMVVSAEGGSVDDRERLIPYLENQVVLRVDTEEGRILVDWQSDF